jgi:stage II sporulation protein GA (sporulation sigma-E factor processing peptidase)
MGQIVYADLLFLVNFSMDFLCFFVTSRILQRRFSAWRCIVASAMGGVYSVAVLFMRLNFLFGLIADLTFCAIMCLIVYGIKDKTVGLFLLNTTVYFGVSMGMGGCMTAMYSLLNRMELPLGEVERNPDGISVWLFGLLAVCSGAVAFFGGGLFKSSAEEISEIDIHYKGNRLSVRGMVDTGNMLRDPVSGRPIIMVDVKVMSGFMNSEVAVAALKGDVSKIISLDPTHKIRVVPMNTASGKALVCAFVPEKIHIRAVSIGKNSSSERAGTVESDALFAPIDLCLPSSKAALGCAALLPNEN